MSFDFLPETAPAPRPAQRRYVWRSTALSAVVAFAIGALLMNWAPEGLEDAVFAVLVLSLLAGGYEFFRLLTTLDEMQRGLHVSAMALGGALVTSFYTLWGLTAVFYAVPDLPAVFAGALLMPAYYIALFIVTRRLR